MINAAVISNVAPLYRKSLWLELNKSEIINFTFYASDKKIFGIETIDKKTLNEIPFKKIRNIILLKRIIWQIGIPWVALFGKYDHFILLGDFTILSNWIALIILKIRRKKTYLWGHGLYGNENKSVLTLRKMFYTLSNVHLLYERRAKQILVNNGFNSKKIYIVFNSLDYNNHKKILNEVKSLAKKDIFPFFKNYYLPVIIFVGRLTKMKKLELLINAIGVINKQGEVELNLLIVGEGPEMNSLKRMEDDVINRGWIYFYGKSYDEAEVGSLIYHADLCVSPGNVGLTAIHSLSYGTPVATHNNLFNQMPEVESIIDGYNGFFFNEDDVPHMVEKIMDWLKKAYRKDEIYYKCRDVIDKFYNPLYQRKVFENAILNIEPKI